MQNIAKMHNSKFTNVRFKALVETIRDVMPLLAVALLVAVYAISGLAAGKFLGSPTLLGKMENGVILAYCIGFAIQCTRGLLVFFRELNPVRPTFDYWGEAIAAGMGILSIYEIYHLSDAAGMGYPVAVSLGILMLAGIGIEIFLLRELRFHTELELFQSAGYWDTIEAYYQARAQFKAKLKSLKSAEFQTLPIATHHQVAPTLPTRDTTSTTAEPGTTTTIKPQLPEVATIAPFSVNGNGKHIAGTVADH
jgi:hypothetical protein